MFFALLSALLVAPLAQAKTTSGRLRALECQLFNLAGFARIQYDARTETARIVTNNLFVEDFKVLYVQPEPDTNALVIKLIEGSRTSYAWEIAFSGDPGPGTHRSLSVQFRQPESFPGPIPNPNGAWIPVPSIPPVVISTGSCSISYENRY